MTTVGIPSLLEALRRPRIKVPLCDRDGLSGDEIGGTRSAQQQADETFCFATRDGCNHPLCPGKQACVGGRF